MPPWGDFRSDHAAVIARSAATKQSRGGMLGAGGPGLLRCARNDEGARSGKIIFAPASASKRRPVGGDLMPVEPEPGEIFAQPVGVVAGGSLPAREAANSARPAALSVGSRGRSRSPRRAARGRTDRCAASASRRRAARASSAVARFRRLPRHRRRRRTISSLDVASSMRPLGRERRHAGDGGAEIAEIAAPVGFGRGREGEITLRAPRC